MARHRLIVSVIAVLGVLLHAGLLVRHNAMMIQSQLDHAELAMSLGVICHADGSTTQSPIGDLPAPNNASGDCPLCMGLMTAVTLTEPAAFNFERIVTSERIATAGERIAIRLVAVCPPPRGPPTNA